MAAQFLLENATAVLMRACLNFLKSVFAPAGRSSFWCHDIAYVHRALLQENVHRGRSFVLSVGNGADVGGGPLSFAQECQETVQRIIRPVPPIAIAMAETTSLFSFSIFACDSKTI